MLRIKDWDETFENAKTRKLQSLNFLSIPVDLDSYGYMALMAVGDRGVEAFGVFLAICQWSATRRPGVRGQLAKSDGAEMPISVLARSLKIDEPILARSIDLLRSPEIGWILGENSKSASHPPLVSQPSASCLPVVRQSSPKNSDITNKQTNKQGKEGRAADEWEIPGRLDTPEVRAALEEFEEMRRSIKKPIKSKKRASKGLREFVCPEHLIYAAEFCVQNDYQGLKPEYRPPSGPGSRKDRNKTFATISRENSYNALQEVVERHEQQEQGANEQEVVERHEQQEQGANEHPGIHGSHETADGSIPKGIEHRPG